MKKTAYILFAAALAMASASCAREEIFDNARTGEVRTFTCSLGEEQTKTDITTKGKTVWSENDSLLVSNGTDADTVVVDRKYAGEKYFSFETQLTGKIYVVYPHNAAKGVEEGKFTLEVPGVQDGTFGSANIACAIADENNTVKMKNVTSVVKFRVPQSTVKPINTVSISSLKDSLAGIFTVDLTSGSPVVTSRDVASSASGVNLNLAGKFGNFYATVIPGSYDAGFSLTAVALDLEHAYESMSTKSATELKANDLYDLGRIGENLKPIGGKGTQADPYQITNLAELTALANVVNNGDSMEGKYIKVMNDIKGVSTTIGYFDDAQPKDKDVYFKGDFDGNGKTITLNLKQTAKKSLALIGDAAYPANIHDVIVDGTVNSTYNYAAGVCAMINGGQGSKITNCTNKATINGVGYVGGIVGYCDGDVVDGIVISGCKNTGAITGTNHSIGGIVGCGLNYTNVLSSTNDGCVKGVHRVGGILGRMDIISKGSANAQLISKCTNNGPIEAQYSVAGITGSFDYDKWAGTSNKIVSYCTNNGKINRAGGAPQYAYIGGIMGRAYGVNLIHCYNNGEILTNGGHRRTGGIAADVQNVDAYGCVNKGKVSGAQSVGGIYGYAYYSNVVNCANVTDTISGAWNDVGGLIGSMKKCPKIVNSYNSSVVYATKPGNNLNAGGLVGQIINKEGNSLFRPSYLFNCYNTGNVVYKDSTLTDPCVGGIVGIAFNDSKYASGSGNIENVYNTGSVGQIDGKSCEKIGSIFGWVQTNGTIRNLFSLEGATNNMAALVNSCTPVNYSTCDANGNLSKTATLGSEKFTNAIEALNANIRINYKGDASWCRWKMGSTGPEFVNPDAALEINLGIDIGNGGNI